MYDSLMDKLRERLDSIYIEIANHKELIDIYLKNNSGKFENQKQEIMAESTKLLLVEIQDCIRSYDILDRMLDLAVARSELAIENNETTFGDIIGIMHVMEQ